MDYNPTNRIYSQKKAEKAVEARWNKAKDFFKSVKSSKTGKYYQKRIDQIYHEKNIFQN